MSIHALAHSLKNLLSSGSRTECKPLRKSRFCRLESLEERALLSVTPLSSQEYSDLRAQYADFNLPEKMTDLNVVTLGLADGDGLTELKDAITKAGTTDKADLIVVRTTEEANTLKFTAKTDELTINIDKTTFGSVTIVGLGEENLTLDANQKCRVMSVSNSETFVNLGGLTIRNGETTSIGGGIYNDAGTLTVANCAITENAASYGGGLCNDNGGSLVVTNSTISGNFASEDGGGIYNPSGTLKLTSSTVSENTAYSYGGGIYNNSNTLEITSSTVSENTAYSYGGGIYNNSNSLKIVNSKISDNTAKYYGFGIYNSSETFTVTNCTIAGNKTTEKDNGIYTKTLTANNSIIIDSIYKSSSTGVVSGSNNLSTYTAWKSAANNLVYNPTQQLFVDADNGDYHLVSNSQAIDKGSNALAVGTDGKVLAYDLDNNQRITNNTVDIGAYEYSNVFTPTLNTPIVNGTVISVSWSSVPNATKYQLEYKLSDDTEWTTKSVSKTSTTFTGVIGETYNIRVKAIGSGSCGDSDYSEQKSVTISEKTQRVYASDISAVADSEITIPVHYEAMDGEGNLTGLGLRIHYNSKMLTYKETENLLKTGLVGAIQDKEDTGNQDGDATTDRVLIVSWQDTAGEWPGSAEQLLMNLKFTVKNDVKDSTQINFTASALAANYSFQATNANITIIDGNFDIDGDETVNLLTDALLVNRYLSEYTGESLTNKAISSGAKRTTADEITTYLNCVHDLLDIDGNGTVDLLTDGLLLNRYVSEYTGESLIKNAIGEGAKRKTADEISRYIANYIPNAYNSSEVTLLKTFLEQTDSSKVKNGTKLNPDYSANDVSTWKGITWSDAAFDKHITKIEWNSDINLTGNLDLSNLTLLTSVKCAGNQLTGLNVSGCTALTDLDCHNNQLTELYVSNHTKLTKLDVSGCTKLIALYCCNNNQLTELNVSGCTALENLECEGNQLTELDVSGCVALEYMSCVDNQLTKLKVSNCTRLTDLYCNNNQLTSLDVSTNTKLETLWCYFNQLETLDLRNNTNLENTAFVCDTLETVYLSSVFVGVDATLYDGKEDATFWTITDVSGNVLQSGISSLEVYPIPALPFIAVNDSTEQKILFKTK